MSCLHNDPGSLNGDIRSHRVDPTTANLTPKTEGFHYSCINYRFDEMIVCNMQSRTIELSLLHNCIIKLAFPVT